MNGNRASRGQPLLVLGLLIGGWIVLRAVLWQAPFAEDTLLPRAELLAAGEVAGEPMFATLRRPPAEPPAAQPQGQADRAEPGYAASPVVPPAPAVAPRLEPLPARTEPPPPRAMPPRMAAGHSLMLMAGFSRLELPPEIARLFAPVAEPAPAAVPFQPSRPMASGGSADRWSADAWLLLRDDTIRAATAGRGSYGQSQLGAVVRYRLVPSSGNRPTAYLRASRALAGAEETEAALGLAARPVPAVPVVVAAELRFTRAGGRTLERPAAYAVSELPPFDLPGGFSGEAYFQAGYVGGKFSTGFVDGQVRAERKLFDLGSADLSAGGGAWGGAQEGASRLDIGPSATVKVAIGKVPSRVSMDWRFRVAGEAEPKSGPALTISAGF